MTAKTKITIPLDPQPTYDGFAYRHHSMTWEGDFWVDAESACLDIFDSNAVKSPLGYAYNDDTGDEAQIGPLKMCVKSVQIIFVSGVFYWDYELCQSKP